jgi:hypothetical protein
MRTRTAGAQITIHARCSEGVATDLDLHAELAGAAPDHAPGIDAVHGVPGELARAAAGGAKEGTFVVAGDLSSL